MKGQPPLNVNSALLRQYEVWYRSTSRARWTFDYAFIQRVHAEGRFDFLVFTKYMVKLVRVLDVEHVDKKGSGK